MRLYSGLRAESVSVYYPISFPFAFFFLVPFFSLLAEARTIYVSRVTCAAGSSISLLNLLSLFLFFFPPASLSESVVPPGFSSFGPLCDIREIC